jgi:class 3 adenylate cyclase
MEGTTGPAAQGVTRGFLFADLRGYTQLVETSGAVEARHLLERYRGLTREVIGRHGGAEIRTEGDSFYVVLPSASVAVRCGLELIDACLHPPDGGASIHVGVGVHAGEAVEYGGDYVGSAVNIAARICAVAAANELLVSGTIREITRSMITARFVPIGRRKLKGIADPVDLFRVVADLQAPPARLARKVWLPVGLGLGGLVAIGAVVALAAAPWSGRQTPSGSTLPSVARTQPAVVPLPRLVVAQNVANSPELIPDTYRPNVNRDVALITIVERGWHLGGDQPDLLAIFREPPQPPRGHLAIARISVVFKAPCPEDPAVLIGEKPTDLITWATTHPQLQTSPPRVVNDLGRTGIAVDATVLAVPAGRCSSGIPEGVRLWQQAGVDVTLAPGTRLTLEALDFESKTLAIAIVGDEPADFTSFAYHARQVLNTVKLH